MLARVEWGGTTKNNVENQIMQFFAMVYNSTENRNTGQSEVRRASHTLLH